MEPRPGREVTYLPDENDPDLLATLRAFLARADANPATHGILTDAESGARIEVPHEVMSAIAHAVDALASGLAVSISPTTQVLTTRQVGDLLGTSHATVLRLLDEGEIPYEVDGVQRCVRLADALAYRQARRDRQYEALAQTGGDDAD